MYSEDQLNKIKEYAGYLMKVDQIALLLDIDLQKFKQDIRNQSSPAYKAYHLGKAETILEIRKQEIQLAKLGSPMAVDLVNRFTHEQKISEK